VRIGRRIVELQPQSAKAAMNLGIVFRRSQAAEDAKREFKRAISLDPSLKQAYLELVGLYADLGRREDMKSTMDSYLKFNPQDILFRLQRQRLNAP
jgi:tetratricopeptide (TPR) repeat protein